MGYLFKETPHNPTEAVLKAHSSRLSWPGLPKPANCVKGDQYIV
jgi:hypothetical protein